MSHAEGLPVPPLTTWVPKNRSYGSFGIFETVETVLDPELSTVCALYEHPSAADSLLK
jgi:hypothetical protein